MMKVFLCGDRDGGRETLIVTEDMRSALDVFEKQYQGLPEVVKDLTADGAIVVLA